MREAQREANEEAKAEYNPAAYGMNRAEEQLLAYHSAGAAHPAHLPVAAVAAVPSVVVAHQPLQPQQPPLPSNIAVTDHRYPHPPPTESRRLSPSRYVLFLFYTLMFSLLSSRQHLLTYTFSISHIPRFIQ